MRVHTPSLHACSTQDNPVYVCLYDYMCVFMYTPVSLQTCFSDSRSSNLEMLVTTF